MSIRKFVAFGAFVLMLSSSVQAMVIPGRWEKMAAEKTGSKIIVTLKTGDRMECTYAGLSKDSLIVSTLDGKEREYSKANVARITTADKRQDSLSNGAGIGALAGLAFSSIPIASCASGKEKEVCGPLFIGVPVMIGIGTLVGVAVDAGIKNYEVLYKGDEK